MRRSFKLGIFAVVAFMALALSLNWGTFGPPLMEALGNSTLLLALMGLLALAVVGWYLFMRFDVWGRLWIYKPLKEKGKKMIPLDQCIQTMRDFINQNYASEAVLKARDKSLTLVEVKTTPTYKDSDAFTVAIFTTSQQYRAGRISSASIPNEELYILSINAYTGRVDVLPRELGTMDRAFADGVERFKLSRPMRPEDEAARKKVFDAALESAGLYFGKSQAEKREKEES